MTAQTLILVHVAAAMLGLVLAFVVDGYTK